MKNKCFMMMLAFLWMASKLQAGDYLALETLDDQTVEPYHVVTQLGVESEEQIDQSTLIHGPTFDAAFGIGEWAEVGVNYEILTLSDSDFFDDSTGSGDIRLRAKIVPVKSDWGNLGFAVITKIPSADESEGLGTGETDVVLKAIYGNHAFADLDWFVNLGAAIQGDSSSNSSQDNFFVWGIGARYPLPAISGSSAFEGLWLIAELEGAIGSETNINVAEGEYNDGDAEFRGGLVKELPWFNLGITGSLGITDDAPDWGFRIVFSRAFDLPVLTNE
jgi:hypothetical protein